ncbi:hypothetical protein H2204_007527 [Knufia peltigerae]|uniref:Xylanolytic transcriptional activator regulatory domain-containing protein n=1 Tax=Knufia peltigerae TaxID=1002370 RepID=A0AA38Y330_9EURO|nr:hypothetical protein H2204_007527 [Knufia peltigerae]
MSGVTGRFVSRGQVDGSNEGHPMESDSPGSLMATAKTPEYSIDLEELCPREDVDATYSTRDLDLTSEEIPEYQSAPAYGLSSKQRAHNIHLPSTPTWAESWYVSYILHTTNNEQPLLNNPSNRSHHGHHPANPQEARMSNNAVRQLLPPLNLIDAMIDAYFAHFHAFCPLLDEAQVRLSLREQCLPTVLLRCMLFVASIHCEMALLREMGYNDRVEAEDSLFNKAKAAFDTDVETDSMTMLCSSYLLHYWSGRPSIFKDSIWWLAGAIRGAQSMGLHRSMRESNAPTPQKRLWRKIWWLLYIRDRQISISLGKPFLINDNDCDLGPLEEDDLTDETLDTRAFVLAQARLAIAASNIFALFSPCAFTCGTSEQDVVRLVKEYLDTFYSQLHINMAERNARRKPLGLILHMTASYYKILAFRMLERKILASATDAPREIEQCTTEILQAAEDVTSHFEEVLVSFKARHFPMICISSVFAAMIVQFVYSRRPALGEARSVLGQQLRFNLLGLKEFEDCYSLAHWIRELFLRIRDRTRTTQSVTAAVAISGTHSTTGEDDTRTATDPNQLDITSNNSLKHSWSNAIPSNDFVAPVTTINGHHDTLGGQTIPDPTEPEMMYSEHPPLDLNFSLDGDSELLRYQTLQMFADEFPTSLLDDFQYIDSVGGYFERPGG